MLEGAFSAHLREAVRRGIIGRAEREAGQVAGAQEMAVCFADLVGFTRLGGEVEPRELGSVAVKLGELATKVARPPVRLVKTIGDAAMFVSPEPGPLVDVALTLLESAEQAELPDVARRRRRGTRAGAGRGLLRPRRERRKQGHRGSAPGERALHQGVRDGARDEFQWSSAGRHKLKGLVICRAALPGAAPPTAKTAATLLDRQQVDDENERRVRRDRRRAAGLAVAQARRDDQLAAAPTFMPSRP